MERFLDQAMKALGSTSRLVWIDDYEFLKAHQIPEAVPFIMLEGNDLGHTTIKNGRVRDRRAHTRRPDGRPISVSRCAEIYSRYNNESLPVVGCVSAVKPPPIE